MAGALTTAQPCNGWSVDHGAAALKFSLRLFSYGFSATLDFSLRLFSCAEIFATAFQLLAFFRYSFSAALKFFFTLSHMPEKINF